MENYVEKALELLISAAESEPIKGRVNSEILEHSVSYKILLKEFRTIKICSARQSGHTTAIFNYADKRKDKQFLLFGFNWEITRRYRLMLKDKNINNIICCSIKEIKEKRLTDQLRGLNIESIFVDVASLLSQSSIDDIYDFAESYYGINKNLLIVFME